MPGASCKILGRSDIGVPSRNWITRRGVTHDSKLKPLDFEAVVDGRPNVEISKLRMIRSVRKQGLFDSIESGNPVKIPTSVVPLHRDLDCLVIAKTRVCPALAEQQQCALTLKGIG